MLEKNPKSTARALGIPCAFALFGIATKAKYMKDFFKGSHKLNSLQYVRALSAIAVVLFHAEGGANKYWQSTAKISLFSWGHVGVPMFFCLSGFVIAYSGYLRPKRRWEFFYSRLARIYPAYMTITFIFVACLIALPSGTFTNAPNVSIEQLIKTFFFDFGGIGGYIYVGWTLFYEMVFYLFFSFLIFRFHDVARSKYFYYAIASGIILCYGFNTPRIADFLIGISVFLLTAGTLGKGDSIPCYALITSLALGVIFHPVGLLCGIIIFCLLLFENTVPSAFCFRPFLTLGDSSYSIYLIQVLTVSASLKIAKLVSLSLPAVASNYLFFYLIAIVFAFLSTSAAGILMRKYLEKPSYMYLMDLKKKSKLLLE